jgi:SAM-dependent methyltransferase
MSDKAITKESYEATAEEFMHNVADLAPMESIQKFVNFFPVKAKIVDIGCGSGRDAKIFTEKGLSVLGIDFSQNLINIAKSNAPLAEFQIMDIEEISFSPSSFDGAWAGCTLSHIPKKILPSVLQNIHSLLKADGYFYLTVKKGVGEGLKEDLRYGNFEKFWSFFEEDEIAEYIRSADFKIVDCCTVQKKFKYQTHPCVRIFCQKE